MSHHLPRVCAASLLTLAGWSGPATGRAEEIPIPHSYDVIVVGAGTGGAAAAIQAARLGSRVALLEETDGVGGQMIEAGVTSIDSFRFDFRSGIWGEFLAGVERVYGNGGFEPRPMGTCYHGSGSTCFEPHVGRNVLRAMIDVEPNLHFIPRTRVVAVITTSGPGPASRPRVTGVTAQVAGTLVDMQSKVLIDATEASYVLALTPARYRAGRNPSEDLDPSACVDSVTYVAAVRKYPDGVPPELLVPQPPGTDYPAAAAFFRTHVVKGGNDGPLPWNWRTHAAYRGMPDSTNPDLYDAAPPPSNWERITRTGVNFANDVDFTVGDLQPANQKTANCRAKMRTAQFLHYMQGELGQPLWSVANDEGYDTSYNVEENNCPDITVDEVEKHMPLFPYYRESLRLVGVHTLTAAEIFRVAYRQFDPNDPNSRLYRARTHFPSSVSLGDYAVDLHGCVGAADLEAYLGESFCDLPKTVFGDGCDDTPGTCTVCRFRYFVGGPFQIPFESFIPERVDGLLAGDKNISATRLAAGAFRLQPSTMLIGQAAGTIAGLSVRHQVALRRLPPILVQNALLAPSPSGAARRPASVSIYGYDDVPRTHPYWAGVQMISTREIMVGNGVSSFFVDRVATRAEAAVVVAAQRSLPLQACTNGAIFTDVPATHFACRHIEAIARAGLANSCPNQPSNLYCPDQAQMRDQEAATLVRAAGEENSSYSPTPHFTDVPPGTTYFPFVQIAFEKGYLSGCSPTSFCPGQTATRGLLADDYRRTLVAKALTQVPVP